LSGYYVQTIKMKNTTVCIIGGGACGVSVLIELMLQLKIANLHKTTKIQLIEKSKEIGLGLAFSTDQPGHLLNTQADLMGIHSFEPDHFSTWLKTHRESVKQEVKGTDSLDESYTTRRLYGNYIQEQFNHYTVEAKEVGLKVDIIQDEAVDLNYAENQWEIRLHAGSITHADHVVLVPGTPKPNNFPELDKRDSYFGFPWPSKPIIEGIPKKADVAVLGSSLSAIDAIMTLTDNGHEGKIKLYSLDGLMPRVQPIDESPYKREFLTLANIHKIRRTKWRQPTIIELFRLFQQEVEHYSKKSIDWRATERKGISASKLLDEDIRIAEAGGDAFINILYDLRYETSQIWDWLSTDEKQKFKQWLGPYWTVTRYGMPLVNAKRLSGLFESGKLAVNSPMHEVTYDDKKHMFILKYGKGEEAESEYLINATGPSTDITMMKSTLLQNLLKKGIIEEYPVGGICIDPEKMEVLTSKSQIKNLYAAGHICNGMLIDVNAVWFNVRTVASLCDHITKKIRHGDPS